jgi:hypothetical protein
VRTRLTDVTDPPGPAIFDPCQQAIGKESAKFIKSNLKALVSCEQNKIKGKHADACPDPGGPSGSAGRKAADKIATAALKFETKVAQLCGGVGKTCGGNTKNEVGGAFLGWPSACPNFESGACSNVVSGTTCTGITQCLACIAGAAVEQATAIYYGSLVPTDPRTQRQLNKCQQTIGRETSKFFLAKEKALQKCWDKRITGDHSAECPDASQPAGSPAQKAAADIAKAETKKQGKICKACGGPGGACATGFPPDVPGDSLADDFTPAQIGFPARCPSVTVPPGPSTAAVPCAGAVSTLEDLIRCVDCVTEYKVDCIERAKVPAYGALPAECN